MSHSLGSLASFAQALSNPRLYEKQILRLFEKYAANHQVYKVTQAAVPLAAFFNDRKRVAKLLARAVSQGEYAFEPATERQILTNGKQRSVYSLQITDRIVHGAIAELLQGYLLGVLSPHVYSYRAGTAWWQGAKDLAAYVRRHRSDVRDIRQRGLYVIKHDIRAYTDSIRVDSGAVLWDLLHRLLHIDPRVGDLQPHHWQLIASVIRPEVCDTSGARFCKRLGVTTGLPIANVLFNLCGMPLDESLGGIAGGFYARYSDDFIFVHPDHGVVREANERAAAILQRCHLKAHEAKAQIIYWTGAGRESADWQAARGTQDVVFLGCGINFRGEIFLEKKKVRKLMSDIKKVVHNTSRALNRPSAEVAGPVVCQALSHLFERRSAFAKRTALLLESLVTSRSQLKQLDGFIAELVVQRLTAWRHKSAFRKVSLRTLRFSWKLPSFFHRRNTHKTHQ